MRHIIESVDFTGARALGMTEEDAHMVCHCGWTGSVADWPVHRGGNPRRGTLQPGNAWKLASRKKATPT